MPKKKEHVLFEQKVCALYRSLGYQVDLDVLIAGQQVDILARRNIPGIGLKTCILECKWTTRKSIANQNVYDFISFMATLNNQGTGADGVIVTNASFSRYAKQAVENSAHVYLKKFSDLERGAFDATDAMSQTVNTYEADEIAGKYIDLSGRVYTEQTGRFPRKGITEYILNDLTEKGRSMTIFGDFGSGKSTLLRRIQYKLSERYLNDEDNKIPILVELKDYRKYGDQLLLEAIRTNTLIRISNEKMKFLLDNSLLYLLLDGFDEISSSADTEERVEFLDGISKFALSKCPTLLTCRPTYFTTRREFWNLSNRYSYEKLKIPKSNKVLRHNVEFLKKHTSLDVNIPKNTIFDKTIDIDPLSQEHIDEFLNSYKTSFRKRLKATVSSVSKFIVSVYDLRDLMTRPLLLQMIVDTLLDGKIDIKDASKSYGPSSIYSLYTGASLARDFGKGEGSQYLTVEQRELFCRRLSVFLLKNGKLELSHTALKKFLRTEAASMLLQEKKANYVDKILTDVRVCSFLKVSDADDLKFTHKSFVEYFTAVDFLENLQDESHKPHLEFNFNSETLLFLSSFLFEDAEYQNIAFKNARNLKLSKSTIRNLTCAICGAPDLFPSLRLRNKVVSDIQIPNGEYRNFIFENSRFTRINGGQIAFQKTKFTPFHMTDCFFKKLSFDSTSGDISVENCNISSCTVEQCTTKFNFSGSSIGFLKFRNCLDVSFGSKFWVDKLSFECSTLLLSHGIERNSHFSANTAIFGGGKILSTREIGRPVYDLLQINRVVIRNTVLEGAALSADCIRNSFKDLDDDEASPISSSTGYVFVAGTLEREYSDVIESANPDLVLLYFSKAMSLTTGKYHLLMKDTVRTKRRLDHFFEHRSPTSELYETWVQLNDHFLSQD